MLLLFTYWTDNRTLFALLVQAYIIEELTWMMATLLTQLIGEFIVRLLFNHDDFIYIKDLMNLESVFFINLLIDFQNQILNKIPQYVIILCFDSS